jgi:hypothetical protein
MAQISRMQGASRPETRVSSWSLIGELTAALELRCVQGPVALSEQVNQRAATAGRRWYFFARLKELEATSGIEPEYTVLQTVA